MIDLRIFRVNVMKIRSKFAFNILTLGVLMKNLKCTQNISN